MEIREKIRLYNSCFEKKGELFLKIFNLSLSFWWLNLRWKVLKWHYIIGTNLNRNSFSFLMRIVFDSIVLTFSISLLLQIYFCYFLNFYFFQFFYNENCKTILLLFLDVSCVFIVSYPYKNSFVLEILLTFVYRSRTYVFCYRLFSWLPSLFCSQR